MENIPSSSGLCPRCGPAEVRTIDSRPSPAGRRRRRLCLGCGERFSTVEMFLDQARRAQVIVLDDMITELTVRRDALAAQLTYEEPTPDG